MPSPFRIAGLLLTALAVAGGGAGPTGAVLAQEPDSVPGSAAAAEWDAPRTPLLDVPYLPQDVLLCGGAAAAMVLRYWGDGDARPEGFAGLVRPAEGGIRTGELVAALRERGWEARAFRGDPSLLSEHLARGRPVVALVAAGDDAFHYVVLLAWTPDGVVLHDPAEGPFRVVAPGEFRRRWAAGGEWSLLVLPGEAPREAAGTARKGDVVGAPARVEPASGPGDPPTPAPADDPCALLAGEAAFRGRRSPEAGGRAGDEAAARALLDAAAEPCAGSPPVLRARAGLAFREEAWARAAALAERAARLDPDDAYGWRLLASSRYLAGDESGALAAWNRVGEPRIEAVAVEGLRRTRYPEVVRLLGLSEGGLLTPGALLRSRRRLALLPASAGSDVRFRPLERGAVRVEAAVDERAVVPTEALTLLGEGLRAGLRGEARLRVANLLGRGDLWSVTGRWWERRPAAGLSLELPAPAGVPGVARLEGHWERRTYGFASPVGGSGLSGPSAGDTMVVEERGRLLVGLRDWVAPTLLLSGGVGAEGWTGRGAHLLLLAGVEHRRAGERLAFDAEVAGWLPADGGRGFGAVTVRGGWRSGVRADPWLLSGRLGARLVSREAPLGLWAGAGAEPVAYGLLRGHALLDDGVVRGPVFGRTLLHGGAELRRVLFRPGPAGLEAALFVDAAVAWDPPTGLDASPSDGREAGVREGVAHADPGAGLRLGLPGTPGFLRLDVARDLRAGRWRWSAGWRMPWPTVGRWWSLGRPVP